LNWRCSKPYDHGRTSDICNYKKKQMDRPHPILSAERKMSVEQKIRDYIVGNFLFGKDENKLQSNSSFLDMGIIDSTGVLEIILFIEEQFGIKMDDNEMLPDNLDSIDNIARFVNSRNVDR
jgi:acyl carrier protein